MNRLLKVLLLLLIITSSLSGCSDANEVDEMTYVSVIGVDKGISNNWRLSMQFPLMKKEGGTGGMSNGNSQGSSNTGNEMTYDDHAIVTVDAPSFFAGINVINTAIPRRINLSHAKLLVFSEDIARSGVVGEFLAPISRYRQIRRTMHVMVTKGDAMDFLKSLKPITGESISKIMETIMKESNDTGLFPHTTLFDFYNSIKSTYSQPISILGAVNSFESFKENGVKTEKPILEDIYHAGEIPRKGGNHFDVFGCALFDGDRMIEELSGEETRFLLIARGDFQRSFFTISDPEVPELIIPLDIRRARKPHVNVSFNKDKPSIDLNLKLEGNILAVQSRTNYENPELKPIIENAFEDYVKTGINKVLAKCKELNIDVFKFGEAAAMKFGTIKEWEEYNWLSRFSEADVKVSVDFKIRRTGTMIRSSEIVSTKGKE